MNDAKETGVRITSLEVENVKRVRAVGLDCSGQALTVIGGRNGQGKTSVLDAIMWTLGGDRYKPSSHIRAGADKVHTKVTLSNGIVAERNGKTGSLTVRSADGKGGQALLNEFVSQFALDLPKFMAARGTEKAQALLDSFPGIGEQIAALNVKVKEGFDRRTAIGQIADRKKKYAAELPQMADAPEQPLSGTEMVQRLTDAMTVNARNKALRENVGTAERNLADMKRRLTEQTRVVAERKSLLEQATRDMNAATTSLDNATNTLAASTATAAQLADTDTTAIQAELEQIDAINAKVRANESKRNAEAEAVDLNEQYQDLTQEIEGLRAERLALLATVAMPLAGLSVDEAGELIYNGAQWDCMSGSGQLRVATAIAAAMKPECGFVLLDKLECMDVETLREFAAWLDERGLQAIGTRVGSDSETSIIIEDGVSFAGGEHTAPTPYSFD